MRELFKESDASALEHTDIQACELFPEVPRTSLKIRYCWGFSTGSRQAAVLVPAPCRASLRAQSIQGYFLVYCLGSWCVVRNFAHETAGPEDAAFPPTRGSTQSLNDYYPGQRGLTEDSATDTHWETHQQNPGRPAPPHLERVFAQHCNKVNLVVYSSALDVCLSGELRSNSSPLMELSFQQNLLPRVLRAHTKLRKSQV